MKQEKGITLIALVITIIVLLILAGVTIAMLTNDNSAPAKANEASQKDAIAAAKDQCAMTAMEAITNYYHNTYVTNGSSTNANSGAQAQVTSALTSMTLSSNVIKGATSEATTSNYAGGTTIVIISAKDKTLYSTGTISATGSITWVDSWANS